MDINVVKNLLLVILVFFAVFTDLRTRKILNLVTYPGALIGLILNCLAFYPDMLQGFTFSISGMLLGVLIFFLPFSLGGLGAGDLKLLGVIGAFMGFKFVLWTGLFSALAGGLISLILILLDPKGLKQRFMFIKGIFSAIVYKLPWPQVKDLSEKIYFPYSIAIAVGLFFSYWLKF